MGLDYTGCEAFLNSLKYVKNKKNILTLGRQGIHINPNIMNFVLNKYSYKMKKIYSGFCEQFLSDFGFENIDSIDNSSYEGASIIHNFNNPISNSLKKYDFILDLGTIEHIFNAPQVCENIINLLNIGGIYLSVTPNNNFSGHGMYQFSPEFYLSAFSKIYGMQVKELYIAKVDSKKESWIDVNNYGNGGNGRNLSRFRGEESVYIIAIIEKISDNRESLILNSPNQYSYENLEWNK